MKSYGTFGRKIIAVVFCLILMVGLSSCCNDTAEDKIAKQTNQMMEESNNELGMPGITNFQQKRTLKSIYELCDQEDLICYAYVQNAYTGRFVYLGRCLGYGIPFSAQYSNPEVYKRVKPSNAGDTHWAYEMIPQPEPNGLYMPESSSATWVLLIDPYTNTGRVVYMEPLLTVSPVKLPPYIVENYAEVEKFEKDLREQQEKEARKKQPSIN